MGVPRNSPLIGDNSAGRGSACFARKARARPCSVVRRAQIQQMAVQQLRVPRDELASGVADPTPGGSLRDRVGPPLCQLRIELLRTAVNLARTASALQETLEGFLWPVPAMQNPRDPYVLLAGDTALKDTAALPGIRQLIVGHARSVTRPLRARSGSVPPSARQAATRYSWITRASLGRTYRAPATPR